MLTGLARTDFEKRLDTAVERFEQRCHADNSADVREFMPLPRTDEDRRIGVELLCVDLQYRWRQGRAKSVEEYQREFPEWLQSDEAVRELAFEAYRVTSGDASTLRMSANDSASVAHNPVSHDSLLRGLVHDDLSDRLPAPNELLSVEWLEACDEFPNVGDCVDGFSLESELGRGALAVVFLARQADLANRHVALKFSLGQSPEAIHLARLVHTHIMPIHSVHRRGPFHILCMPFLGRETLESHLRSRHSLPLVRATADAPSIDTYVRWMRDLAAGLDFAHRQQIVHSDLKPANILLADHGSPMLMDFNLSDDLSQTNRAYLVAGGTLPYLAPEHLQRLQRGGRADASTDLYSLGVIFYQLLTGRLPFPQRRGSFDETIQQMIRDRQQRPQHPDRSNRAVSPSLGAIVQKLLASSLGDRYGSAKELIEDLDRHLENRPLIHADNPSLRERMAKFSRRHPALTSGTMIATLSMVILSVSIFSTFLLLGRTIKRSTAMTRMHGAQNELPQLRAEITDPLLDATDGRLAWKRLHEQLTRCQLDTSIVRAEALFSYLPQEEQDSGRDVMTQLLYLASLHWEREARSATENSEKLASQAQAKQWNERAQELVARHGSSMSDAATVVRWQATRLSQATNQQAAASAVRSSDDREEAVHMRDPSARLLAALTWLSEGQYDDARMLLESIRDATPHDPSVWLLLGNAYAGLERLEDAEACYGVCMAMWPRSYVGPFYRGLARLQQQHYQQAADDFTLALQRSPQLVSALMNRAAAHTELQQWEAAEADLTQAIELRATQTRTYLLRADLRRRLNRLAEAEADEAEGLRRVPTDELSWVQRGLVKARTNPQAAAQDLQKALDLNPNSRYALRNLAYVYGERMGDLATAMNYLERLAQLHAHADDFISMAVYHARQHRSADAVASANQALKKNRSGKILFQAACVHSLLREANEPATRALAYLEESLAVEPQWVRIAVSDPDLQSIRNEPEFQAIVQAAQQRMVRQNAVKQIE